MRGRVLVKKEKMERTTSFDRERAFRSLFFLINVIRSLDKFLKKIPRYILSKKK